MTDDVYEQEPVELPALEDGVERDYELQALVSLMGRGIDGMGLTVNVGGTVMSGLLVSQERWHKLLLERHADGGGFVANVLTTLRDGLSIDDDEPEPGIRAYHFLHLSHGRIWTGDGMIGSDLMWRVRISEVSAWMLGRLGPT